MSISELLDKVDIETWKSVPNEACRLAKEAAGTYSSIVDAFSILPELEITLWYNPDNEKALFKHAAENNDEVVDWILLLKQVPGISEIEHGSKAYPPDNEPYLHIKQAKTDLSDIFAPLASLAQLKENSLNRLWGGPNALAATIGGGLLGAGMGYGGGCLAEKRSGGIIGQTHFDH